MLAAIPVLCAYKVGGCKTVFDMSVNYARERTQFGQVIGRFQRVQDHVIHIVNYLDAARWTTYEALWKLDSGADAAASVHVAKSVVFGELHARVRLRARSARRASASCASTASRCTPRCRARCITASARRSVHRKRLESVLGLVPA